MNKIVRKGCPTLARRNENSFSQIIMPGRDHGIETQTDNGAMQFSRLPGRSRHDLVGKKVVVTRAVQGVAEGPARAARFCRFTILAKWEKRILAMIVRIS
jgi:hypothetical protein